MKPRTLIRLSRNSKAASCIRSVLLVLACSSVAFSVEGEGEAIGTYLGAASCAASTCHGGVLARGSAWRSAWTLWSSADPHVNAGLSLKTPASLRIVLGLIGRPETDVTQNEIDHLLRERCISCHVTATPQQCSSTEPLKTAFLLEGVSCESCHGASGGWLVAHLKESFPVQQQTALGFRDTKSILSQTQGCVRCHVGSRTSDGLVRDMNHDMIAAGHPVLRFDMESYLRALPPHWGKIPESEQTPVRNRQVGRSIALSAAAGLAADRASAFLGGEGTPFPEFADYDCFGCHQSLSIDDYATSSGSGEASKRISDGIPIWNAWYGDNLLDLKKNRWRMIPPDSGKAEQITNAASHLQDQFLRKAKAAAQQNFDAMEVIRQAHQRCKADLDWHEAAVLVMDVDAALRALALRDASFETIRNSLIANVGVFLRFRVGLQSPDTFDQEAKQKFQRALMQLLLSVDDSDKPTVGAKVHSNDNQQMAQ